jgi:abortive infection bacteriophage resistance protein
MAGPSAPFTGSTGRLSISGIAGSVTSYAKPYKTIAEQIALLESRGLVISDRAKATACLERIGYYRLSAYWFPFRETRPGPPDPVSGRPTIEYLDQFKPSASLLDAMALYVFDKKLRMLVMDAAERVEVGLRVDVALLASKRDPWAHRKPAEVNARFANAQPPMCHSEWLRRHDENEQKSKEEFAVHFRNKYGGNMPLWMAIELWDFGMLSVFLSGMKDADVTALANKYNLPRRDLLKTWVRSINYVRNISAHHKRLWNRPIVDQPQPPRVGELPGLDHLAADQHAQRRVYAVLVVLRWLLLRVNPASSWPQRLKAHMQTFPANPYFSPKHAGFPDGWDALPYWS